MSVRRVILANDQTLRVVRVPGEAGVFSFLDDLSAADARRYLEEYAGDSMALSQLRMALSEDSLGMPVTYLDDADVLDEVAWRVSMNQLTIAEEIPRPLPKVPEPEPASSSAAAPPPELPRTKKLTFIELKVVWAETGKPVKNVRLVVRTPDGVEKFHDTNGEGKVRVEEVEPGTCDVRGDLKNVKAENIISFVGMGEPKASAESENGSPPKTGAGPLVIAGIKSHKVKTGESIASLAKRCDMTWQELAKLNWGTDVPDRINNHLKYDVGCTRKTKDGKNYVFDNSDDPGLMDLPTQWEQGGLSTGGEHVIQVAPLVPARPWQFSI
jgi:hypothetical protein